MMNNEEREKLIKRLGLGTRLIRDLGSWVGVQRFYRRYNLEKVVDNPMSDEETDQFLCNEQMPQLEEAVGLKRPETPGCIKSFYKWVGGTLLAGFLLASHGHYTQKERMIEYQSNIDEIRASQKSEVEVDSLVARVSADENVPVYVLASIERFRPDISTKSGLLPVLLEDRKRYLQAAADVFHDYHSTALENKQWFEDDDQIEEVALSRFFFSEDEVNSARDKGNIRVMQYRYVKRCLDYGDDYDWELLEKKYSVLCEKRKKGNSSMAEKISDEIVEFMKNERPWGISESDFEGLCCYFTERDNFVKGRWWANNLPETKQLHYALRVKNGR